VLILQLKLDVWKLENPKVDITARVSLPMNQQHSQNLQFSDFSLNSESPSTKSIGGLIHANIPGTFLHMNTIEEYNALDLNTLVQAEAEKVTSEGF
jgi:hypothetical protein